MCVKVSVLNVNPPSKVEMEYWANEKYKDQGNITALALDVIEDIFNKRTFDGLKVRNVFPFSNITSIMVSINKDNYASLAVAKNLGFNEQGYLEKDKYLLSKEKSSGGIYK